MEMLIQSSLFAAVGYSLICMLEGGGIFGAIVIFVIAKMLGRKSIGPSSRMARYDHVHLARYRYFPSGTVVWLIHRLPALRQTLHNSLTM